ncbi:MAG TPA: calcium/sodium antiporter [Bacteroidales bacterium]|jgi:cation:H+ antiporter|nr:sodium:proton exchanger [Bacteroidota bacterium]HJN06432.1 calcium/sodium antiporter [Bacteroidales bacterium]|tara:strand:- start:1299 stop:2252 length:954 start_codon:yes stop_codon:yes gene_type:complete
MIVYILFVLGFVILIFGAKFLVDGASSIGVKVGLSQLIIGLTIVAFGTSLPELVINVFASLKGSSGLAIGNVLGSNIMNTLLIIGITAIIYPIKVDSLICKRDSWINLIAILLVAILANDLFFGKQEKIIDRVDGIILLIFFIIMLYVLFSNIGKRNNSDENKIISYTYSKSIILIILGSLGLFFGGKWIVSGALAISYELGVSESTIGLTLVAAATSLPELVTSIVAALKKNTDIAIGNALGSNIFNIFLVLGTSATIHPINFESSLNIEIGILIVASLFLMLVIRTGNKARTITRLEGVFLTLGYFIFLFWSIFS